MTKNQLQKLIASGVFSAALLSGVIYADEPTTAPGSADPAVSAPAKPKLRKHKKSKPKKTAKHSCAGQNSCKGQGGCGSSDGGCTAKNSCKGKGGCATDGSM